MRPRELVDISLDTRTRRQRLRRRLTRVVVPLGCLILMIASIGVILIYAYQNNREDALILTDDLLKTLDRQIATEVQHYLSPASEMVKLATNIVKDPAIAINSRAQVEPLAIQILKNYQQLTIFSIADVKGNFIMPKKMPNGSIDTKIIDRTANNKQVKWVRRDLSGAVITEEIVTDDTYDARTRPWYAGAVKARGLYWTDVYIFFTDQKPGVTAAMPVIDDNDQLQGVLGVDIELDQLNHFLRELTIGRNGRALIIDGKGRLVAYPQAKQMLKREGDQVQPVTLDELGDSVLSRAYNRFKIEGHGHRILSVENQRYLNSVSSLRSTVVRDWSVMIVVPEEDFVGFVKKNITKSLLMTTVIVVLASVMAGLLVFQGLRADRNAREILNRKQEVEVQSQAFSTLASDAAVFDPADAESLGRLTEIVSEAAAVRRASFWQLGTDGTRLVCLDCYDNESKGHTRGTLFERKDFPQLFAFLQKGEDIIISDTVEDTNFSSLHQAYLQPMGCRALLAVPVICHDHVKGTLWFEHEGKSRPWDVGTISFAKAIAGLLALRLSAGKKQMSPEMDQDGGAEFSGQVEGDYRDSDQPVATVELESPAPLKRVRKRSNSESAPLGDRPASFADMLKARGYDDQFLKADVYVDATVLALRFIDPLSLAKSFEKDHSRLAIDGLVCHFEEMAKAYALDYWNIASDQIVCAAGLGGAATDHTRVIADIALSLQDHCAHLFADLDKIMAFRIGIDRGAVIGSTLGRRHRFYNIWGDAVGTAVKMVDHGVDGGIHVSQAAYLPLRESFVFKVRGSFYLKNIGEISTYLLTGRI